MTTTVASNRDQLVALIGELSDEQVDALTPFMTDLVEVARSEEGLEQLDRDEFREHLDLDRILPEPTITELSGVTLAGSQVGLEDQKAAGNYDWVNSDITVERFPLTLPAGPQDLALAHFDVDVSSEQVEAWAVAHGYEPALIDDLLAVGAHGEYRELQRQFPIVALKSSAVIRGLRHVPCLYGLDSHRSLRLNFWDYDWRALYRFLFRKVSKPSVT
jgi:hypothetical protein